MIVDQAEQLRRMVRRSETAARVLAITSGKGGVGKTNVAANLAICLGACGRDVTLLDADLGLANLDVVLGLKPRYNLAHVVSGRRHIEDVVQDGPAGVRVVCGASGLAQIADLSEFQRQQLLHQMVRLEQQADIIVIDTGAGISSNVLGFCNAADHTLVVTTAEPTSITDAYALIKNVIQHRSDTRISLLVNMVDSRDEAKRVYQRIAHVAQKFLSVVVYDAGYIVRDQHVSDAVHQREPVTLAYPRCRASYCFLTLARKLSRAADNHSEARDGFFRKVVNWFC